MAALIVSLPGTATPRRARARIERHERRPAGPSRAHAAAHVAAHVSPAVYRRRRIVVGTIAAAVVVALVIAVAGLLADRPLTVVERRAPAGAEHAPLQLDARPVSRQVHVVQPGETVWSIARSVGSDGDIRPVVDALVAQLGGRAAQPGDRLVLP